MKVKKLVRVAMDDLYAKQEKWAINFLQKLETEGAKAHRNGDKDRLKDVLYDIWKLERMEVSDIDPGGKNGFA